MMRKLLALLLSTGLLAGCSANAESTSSPEVSSEEAAATELGQSEEGDDKAHEETCAALSDSILDAALVFSRELSSGESDATKRLRFQTALSRIRTIYDENFDTIIASKESMGIDVLVAEVNSVEVLVESPSFQPAEVGGMLKTPLEEFADSCDSDWTPKYIDGLFAMNYGEDYVEVVLPDDLDGHISKAICDAVQQNIRLPYDEIREPVLETLMEPYGVGKVAVYACYQPFDAMVTIFEYPSVASQNKHLTQLATDIAENSLPNGKLMTNRLFSIFYWGDTEVQLQVFQNLGFQLFTSKE